MADEKKNPKNVLGQELIPDPNPIYKQHLRVIVDTSVYEKFRAYREQLLMDGLDEPNLNHTAAMLATK
jgi:hypothetical protein